MCGRAQLRISKSDVVMRQEHKAGEKLFVASGIDSLTHGPLGTVHPPAHSASLRTHSGARKISWLASDPPFLWGGCLPLCCPAPFACGNYSGEGERGSGIDLKRSASTRNAVGNHPGIAITFARTLQLTGCLSGEVDRGFAGFLHLLRSLRNAQPPEVIEIQRETNCDHHGQTRFEKLQNGMPDPVR